MERPKIRYGAIGGLIGGLVFAGIMVVNGTLANMGMLTLPLIGSLVGHPSAWVGFGVHMLNSAVIGVGYVLIFGRIAKGMVDGLHFGMLYGAIWWFVGPLTLMPLLTGGKVAAQWTFPSMLGMFPSFIGHIVYGAILGLTVGAFRDASLPVAEEVAEPDEKQMRSDASPTDAIALAPLPVSPPSSERRRASPLFIRRRPAPGTEESGGDAQ